MSYQSGSAQPHQMEGFHLTAPYGNNQAALHNQVPSHLQKIPFHHSLRCNQMPLSRLRLILPQHQSPLLFQLQLPLLCLSPLQMLLQESSLLPCSYRVLLLKIFFSLPSPVLIQCQDSLSLNDINSFYHKFMRLKTN